MTMNKKVVVNAKKKGGGRMEYGKKKVGNKIIPKYAGKPQFSSESD